MPGALALVVVAHGKSAAESLPCIAGLQPVHVAVRRGGPDPDATAKSREEEKKLRHALLERKREVLLALRLAGTVDDTVACRIQTRLDVEEQRLTGVETYD